MNDRPEQELPADPTGIEEPHDVLAAEEFALPTPAPGAIPRDPIHQPHDVLAAEEFAMPAAGPIDAGGPFDPRSLIPGLALAGVLLLMVKLLRRQRG